jgi:hypothetical protein
MLLILMNMIEGTLTMLREVVLVAVLVCIDVDVRSIDDVENIAVIGCVSVVDGCEVEDVELNC